MASFESPSAASKIILARTTWKYGNVYLAVRLRSSVASLGDSTMGYGLSRGIPGAILSATGCHSLGEVATENTLVYL